MEHEYTGNEGEKPLKDYDLSELQDYADSINSRYKKSTDKEVRRILRNKWKEITSHYNERVNFEAYRTSI